MQISAMNSTNFSSKFTRFYVPGKENTTLRCVVESDMPTKIKGLSCDILSKGKVVEQKTYQNKNGFDTNRLAVITDEIQQKVKEGYEFLDELFDAIIRGGN